MSTRKKRRGTRELLVDKLDPKRWVTLSKNTGGIRIYQLWVDKKTGAHFCLLDVPKGGTVPIRHRHASNQFMYCLKGQYEYKTPGGKLVLKPGSFYMNPKGNYHGPTVARSRCLLLECYDGPHYFEKPSFHTSKTIGKMAAKTGVRKGSATRASRSR
jgi:2,4'-dihydroxyacetophenone dioxygenase